MVEVNLLVDYFEADFLFFQIILNFIWFRTLRIPIEFSIFIALKKFEKDIGRIKEIQGAISGTLKVQIIIVYHTILVSAVE